MNHNEKNKNKHKNSESDKKNFKTADKQTRSSHTSSNSGKGSRKNSLNETISELESHPDKIKEKYKELIENSDTTSTSKYIYNNELDQNNERKGFSVARFLFAFGFVSIAFTNSYFKLYVPKDSPTRITDVIHNKTESIYDYLKSNENIRVSLVNTTAIIQDIGFVAMCYYWITKGTNWRPVCAFVLLFFIKLLNTITFTFLPISGALWDSPEYYSLTYPTNKDYNYFFTGLVAVNFLCFEFLYDYKSNFSIFLSFLCFLNTFFQMFFFVGLRAMYIIDVGTSLMVAHYSYYCSDFFSRVLEKVFALGDEIKIANKELIHKKYSEESELISEVEHEKHIKIGKDEIYLKREQEEKAQD